MEKDICYDENVRRALIRECVSLFEQMRRSGMKSVYCGTPPDTLVLRIGHYPAGEEHELGKFPRNGAEAYLYRNRRLAAAYLSRRRSRKKQGVYYEEAYAEAAYDDCGKAYIKMDYGPRYTSGSEYDIIDNGRTCRLAKQRHNSACLC